MRALHKGVFLSVVSLMIISCSDETTSTALYREADYGSNTIVNLSESSGNTNEDIGFINIPLTIKNPSASNNTEASFSLISDNADDFVDFDTSKATFLAGTATSQNIVLTLAHNDYYEEPEVVTLSLNQISGGNNATAGNNSTYKLTIDYIFKEYLGEVTVNQTIEPLIGYKIEDGFAIEKKVFDVPPASKVYQDDSALKSKMYQQFTSTIPYDYRKWLVEYEYMDGNEVYLGYVFPVSSNLNIWRIALDARSAKDDNGVFDGDLEFTHTVIHESTHLFTLNGDQFDAGQSSGCSNFKKNGGCAKDTSYMQQFYDTFWTQDIKDDYDTYDNDTFYNLHTDVFVNSYAASQAPEDIAETFSFYVLKENIVGYNNLPQSLKDKINWFDRFPELVKLRNQIRANLISLGSITARANVSGIKSTNLNKMRNSRVHCAPVERN